mmetsp:Transcript_18054/g.34231  ORF Transcript_18054/g.34231 Transcript_18054/m.34231 type:complete len:90 (-) Transcript_18054:113-382(-)
MGISFYILEGVPSSKNLGSKCVEMDKKKHRRKNTSKTRDGEESYARCTCTIIQAQLSHVSSPTAPCHEDCRDHHDDDDVRLLPKERRLA